MAKTIKQISKSIERADQQRRRWLYASSFVFVGVVAYITGWHWIHNLHNPYIEWSLVSIGLVVTMNWWYWTMGLIRQYINHQRDVMDVLSDIVDDLKTIKSDVKKLNTPVDKEDKIL